MQMELSVKDRGERDESGGQGEFQDQRGRVGPHHVYRAESYNRDGGWECL